MEKKLEDGVVRPDKMQVLQESRAFSATPISPRRCRVLLTKLALLLFTGESFGRQESTQLFFAISKLFQSKDASLRQMSYAILPTLARNSDDVLMLVASIMKDCALPSDVVFKPNALRSLIRVIDGSMAVSIERSLKTALTDRQNSVVSAALVSSYHLLPVAKDVVRRWSNEIQAALDSGKSSGSFFGMGGGSAVPTQTSYHQQYHAIGLLYELRRTDRMSVIKLLQQYSSPGAVKSPAAVMLLVKIASNMAHQDPNMRKPMLTLLDGFLRHKSEMVNFEAAKAIANFPDLTDAECTNAIHTLQLFLASPRNVTKFAACRLLSTFATFKPDVVRVVNTDLESLITSSNRSIATYAISTLLRTGTEQSFERLLKQINSLISEISDDSQKVTIIDSFKTLALKYPARQAAMVSFLSAALREEGGFEFKQAIVNALFDMSRFVPESKSEVLACLAEFIEDCEYSKLAVRVLHLLGQEGPSAEKPSRFIRTIYNRCLLENAVVRASAVQALSKFGLTEDAELRKSIQVLLTRALDDSDDEVRDRAALGLRLVEESEDRETSKKFLRNDSMFSLPILEHQLTLYCSADDKENFETPFDLTKIPQVSRDQADAEERTKKLAASTPTLKAPSAGAKASKPSAESAAAAASVAQQKYQEELQKIPEAAAYGALLKSSPLVELTESETEYVVGVVKHIFKEALVLQFDITNTLEATVLTDVTVASVPEEEDLLEEDWVLPAAELKTNEPGVVYVAFKATTPFAATTFTNQLRFTSKEIDPTTGEPDDSGYEDEYQVEDLDLTGSDYVVPAYAGSFDNVWEQSNGEEASETLQLSNMKSIGEAVEQLTKALSLQPLEGTDVALSTSTHTLKLYGKTITGGKVAAMVRMAYAAKTGVTIQIKCRSEEEGVAALVVGGVA